MDDGPTTTTSPPRTAHTRYRISCTKTERQNKWFRISFDASDDTTSPQNLRLRKKQKIEDRKEKERNDVLPPPRQRPKPDDDESRPTTTTTVSSDRKVAKEEEGGGHDSESPSTAQSQSCVPESVLRYERQMRKLRAADRASKTNVNAADHLKIVYADDHVAVADKPSGVLCVPGVNQNRSLLDLVYEAYGSASAAAATANEKKEDEPSTSAAEESNAVVAVASPLFPRDSMIVHRLDMDTSGIVVFARTRAAMSKLHESFRERTGTKKVYEALLLGRLDVDKWIQIADEVEDGGGGDAQEGRGADDAKREPSSSEHTVPSGNEGDDDETNLGGGEINLPLQRDHRHPPFMRVSTPESEAEAREAVKDLNHNGYKKLVAKNPKASKTRFRVLSHERWFGHRVTRVELIPITGRTHQLRAHCAAMGHPILGDSAYGFCGEAHPNGGFADEIIGGLSPTCAAFELRRDVEDAVRERGRTMCLHARQLMIDHPATGERVSFEAAPDF